MGARKRVNKQEEVVKRITRTTGMISATKSKPLLTLVTLVNCCTMPWNDDVFSTLGLLRPCVSKVCTSDET